MREMFEKLGEQMARGRTASGCPRGWCYGRRRAAGGHRRAWAGRCWGCRCAWRRRRASAGLTDGLLTPAVLDLDRPAPVGRPGGHGPRAAALRVGAGGRLAGPGAGVAPHAVPVDPDARPARADAWLRTGRRPRADRPAPAACDRFVAAEGDGLLSVFVPHATAGVVIMELGAGRTTTSRRRSTGCCPATSDTGIGTASPGHGADHVLPLLVPPSLTVPVVRRPAGAGHLAVDRAARPQRRQPMSDRPLDFVAG